MDTLKKWKGSELRALPRVTVVEAIKSECIVHASMTALCFAAATCTLLIDTSYFP